MDTPEHGMNDQGIKGWPGATGRRLHTLSQVACDELAVVARQRYGHRFPQAGASMTEFLIVAPVMLFLGLGTVQAGLIYHGKTILNYATFEAARTGATNHAQVEPMRKELGTRLAPLQGGDGEQNKAMAAIIKSRALINDPLATRIEIISPAAQSFEAWGVTNADGRTVIPNSHLRHQTHDRQGSTEITLQDANLLKIKVTHGLDLKIPFVSGFLMETMMLIDPENIAFYSRGKFPLTSVATVRMQSEAWEDAIVSATAAIAAADESVPPQSLVEEGTTAAPDEFERCVGSHGLGGDSGFLPTIAVSEGECGASSTQFDSPERSPFEDSPDVFEYSPTESNDCGAEESI